MQQERYLCNTCQQEWLGPGENQNPIQIFVAGSEKPKAWEENDGCPMCKSSDIKLVRYRPPFRGGDIPRDIAVAPKPVEAVQVTPTVNTTLALSRAVEHEVAEQGIFE